VIIYLLFILVFFVGYIADSIGGATRVISWLPELLSGLVAIQVVFLLATNRKIQLSAGYLFIFISITLLMIAAVIANAVQPGAIFAGIRTYMKYLPFFFLPLVVPVASRALQLQLKLVLVLVLLQVPVTIYQRFIQYAGLTTGDVIEGTLVSPSALTFVSLSTVAIIISAYYKKYIKLKYTVILASLLLIPPTLNETTITIFLLPLTFLIPTLLFSRQSEDKGKLYAIIFIGSLVLLVFGGVYNYMYSERWDGSITNFELMADDMMKEEISDESDARIKGEVRRIDSIILALRYLSKYPSRLAMGVGIGNAGDSFSDKLIGEMSLIYAKKGGSLTALAHLLWEVGVLGVILIVTLFVFIFLDACTLAYKDDIYGVLALGWSVVISFIFITFVYKNLISHDTMGYLFWYFSGCIVAERYRSRMTMVLNRPLSRQTKYYRERR